MVTLSGTFESCSSFTSLCSSSSHSSKMSSKRIVVATGGAGSEFAVPITFCGCSRMLLGGGIGSRLRRDGVGIRRFAPTLLPGVSLFGRTNGRKSAREMSGVLCERDESSSSAFVLLRNLPRKPSVLRFFPDQSLLWLIVECWRSFLCWTGSCCDMIDCGDGRST